MLSENGASDLTLAQIQHDLQLTAQSGSSMLQVKHHS